MPEGMSLLQDVTLALTTGSFFLQSTFGHGASALLKVLSSYPVLLQQVFFSASRIAAPAPAPLLVSEAAAVGLLPSTQGHRRSCPGRRRPPLTLRALHKDRVRQKIPGSSAHWLCICCSKRRQCFPRLPVYHLSSVQSMFRSRNEMCKLRIIAGCRWR